VREMYLEIRLYTFFEKNIIVIESLRKTYVFIRFSCIVEFLGP
jgi:hypothetical protein